MPKQIDLEPTNYRSPPAKGEPIFKAGGLRRLGIVIVAFAISGAVAIAVGITLRAMGLLS
jgi:hypothetical protein